MLKTNEAYSADHLVQMWDDKSAMTTLVRALDGISIVMKGIIMLVAMTPL
jgi:hypothetical protein